MAKIRLRYENGHFVPLDEVTGIQEGQEVLADLEVASRLEELDRSLRRSAGAWHDLDGIEEFLADIRAKVDDEWRQYFDF